MTVFVLAAFDRNRFWFVVILASAVFAAMLAFIHGHVFDVFLALCMSAHIVDTGVDSIFHNFYSHFLFFSNQSPAFLGFES